MTSAVPHSLLLCFYSCLSWVKVPGQKSLVQVPGSQSNPVCTAAKFSSHASMPTTLSDEWTHVIISDRATEISTCSLSLWGNKDREPLASLSSNFNVHCIFCRWLDPSPSFCLNMSQWNPRIWESVFLFSSQFSGVRAAADTRPHPQSATLVYNMLELALNL